MPALPEGSRSRYGRAKRYDRTWPAAGTDADPTIGAYGLQSGQISVCSAISRASSTSMPRYRTVLSSLWTAVHRLETTALYAQVATDLLREVISPLEPARWTGRHIRSRFTPSDAIHPMADAVLAGLPRSDNSSRSRPYETEVPTGRSRPRAGLHTSMAAVRHAAAGRIGTMWVSDRP